MGIIQSMPAQFVTLICVKEAGVYATQAGHASVAANPVTKEIFVPLTNVGNQGPTVGFYGDPQGNTHGFEAMTG
jgi:hypothetical protein